MTGWRPVAVRVLAIALGAIAGQSGAPPAQVSGVVQDLDGVGIANTLVRLVDATGTGYITAVTDELGRFVFPAVTSGVFSMSALRTGYLPAGSSASQPGARVTVTPGAPLEPIVLTLQKAGLITGTVRDETGDPVRAAVVAIPRIRSSSVRTASPYASTDDRGRYRIPDLPPGEYLVGTVGSGVYTTRDASGNERTLVTPPTYYPGVLIRNDASHVVVDGRSEVSGIDLQLVSLPATSLTVALSAPVSPLVLPQVWLRKDDGSVLSTTTRLIGTSTVEIHGMIAGRYTVAATASDNSKPARRWWATREVTSDGVTPASLAVVLERGPRVAGRIVVEGQGAAPRPKLISLTRAEPFELETVAMMTPGGTFSIEVQAPGTYVFGSAEANYGLLYGPARPLEPASTWGLKAATVRGRDILDLPFTLELEADWDDVVLTFTNRLAEISGSVADADGNPLRRLTLVVFATNPPYWYPTSRRIRMVQPDAKGRYIVGGLPAGDYWIAAVSGVPQFPQGLTAGLTDLSAAAVRISLKDGEKKQQDLRGSGR